jgi:hypothetical protein
MKSKLTDAIRKIAAQCLGGAVIGAAAGVYSIMEGGESTDSTGKRRSRWNIVSFWMALGAGGGGCIGFMTTLLGIEGRLPGG